MKISGLCEIQMGFTAPGKLEPIETGGVPVIQLRDVPAAGRLTSKGLLRTDMGEAQARYFVNSGDVLFRSRGEINTASVVDSQFEEPALVILPLMILRPKPDLITPEFLAWSINQPRAQRHFRVVAQGTSLRMVPRSGLEALQIDVPNLETQRQIVALDALIERERTLSVRIADVRRNLVNFMLAKRVHASMRNAKHGGAQ